MRADHGPKARKELRCRTSWPMETLRYELRYQQAEGIHTWGPGRCGHDARGSGFCAACIQGEIDTRQQSAREGLGGGE